MSWKDFQTQALTYKNKMYRFALRFVGNPAEAEDIVQEVFIKLWNQKDRLGSYNNLEAWCMKLTRNLSIDKLRSKHRRVEDIEGARQMASGGADPHRKAEVSDLLQRVREIMQTLPENQRIVLQLRDIEEMTYQEISDATELSLAQVKVNLFRARQHIRTQMANMESYGL
ncbi:MAG: sigma-70 family RNA polymerase sigma factor [Bacteroidota bacterium]